jgi:hypothetical protein
MAELAARKQRRTLSSFIEWAIEEALQRLPIEDPPHGSSDAPITFTDAKATLWDVEEADRFAQLALNYPGLLTYGEQKLWKFPASQIAGPVGGRTPMCPSPAAGRPCREFRDPVRCGRSRPRQHVPRAPGRRSTASSTGSGQRSSALVQAVAQPPLESVAALRFPSTAPARDARHLHAQKR